MNFKLNYWHLIFTCLVSSLSGASDVEDGNGLPLESTKIPPSSVLVDSLTPKDLPSKRKARCPSLHCKVDLKKHLFGPSGKSCPGPPSTTSTSVTTSVRTKPSVHFQATSHLSPTNTMMNVNNPAFSLAASGSSTPPISSASTSTNLVALRKQLASLESEHEALQTSIQSEEQLLLQQIQEKQRALDRLRHVNSLRQPVLLPTNTNPGLSFPSLLGTHTNDLLSNPLSTNHLGPSSLTQSNINNGLPSVRSLADLHQEQRNRTSEIFLRPLNSTNNELGKPLRIPDFVSRIRPQEEEKVLTTDAGQQTKLTLSLGQKKPKLESLSVEDFAIANTRIFYELLSSRRLASDSDLRDYLSYTIKIFELARKYTWESVLRYDDEFRIVQHTYGYPWSHDNSHMHEIVLFPRWAAGNLSNPTRSSGSGIRQNASATPPALSVLSVTGEEICRNFNRTKGCQKKDCKFAHVCNRKVGNQACSSLHPGCQHFQQQKAGN